MSGYLEVKYPFKSNLGLNPFKSWKRQWCILRPSGTCRGGSLAVYCSEAGAAAGTVALPAGGAVRRAKSRSRPYAFAVFAAEERKPRLLLAAHSLHEANTWMDKIRALLNGDNLLGTETLLKDSYSVSVVPTDLSNKYGINGDGVVTLSSKGVLITRAQKHGTLVEWRFITEVALSDEDKNQICILTVDRSMEGGGSLKLCTPLAGALCGAAQGLRGAGAQVGAGPRRTARSKSDSDLRDQQLIEDRRSSWYSGPSEVSLDDLDLIMSKECTGAGAGALSRCSAERDLAPRAAPAAVRTAPPAPSAVRASPKFNNSLSDRRSLLSIASGIYEEIPDLPELVSQSVHTDNQSGHEKQSQSGQKDESHSGHKYGFESGHNEEFESGRKNEDAPQSGHQNDCNSGVFDLDNMYLPMGGDLASRRARLEEPTYESVSECVYGTMRRTGKRFPPPPLPPRLPFGASKLGASWGSSVESCGYDVTRHRSASELPRPPRRPALPTPPAATLPHTNTFSVFRKRLKSDSRIAVSSSGRAEPSKDTKSDTKKKRFDFAPTRDIFKSFKVGRKMKNLKITAGTLAKGETKSCEFLDESEHVTTNRSSKSVECLESDYIDDADLSMEFNEDSVAALAFPQEIIDLILRGQESSQVRGKQADSFDESEYIPMSPIVPQPPIIT